MQSIWCFPFHCRGVAALQQVHAANMPMRPVERNVNAVRHALRTVGEAVATPHPPAFAQSAPQGNSRRTPRTRRSAPPRSMACLWVAVDPQSTLHRRATLAGVHVTPLPLASLRLEAFTAHGSPQNATSQTQQTRQFANACRWRIATRARGTACPAFSGRCSL